VANRVLKILAPVPFAQIWLHCDRRTIWTNLQEPIVYAIFQTFVKTTNFERDLQLAQKFKSWS